MYILWCRLDGQITGSVYFTVNLLRGGNDKDVSGPEGNQSLLRPACIASCGGEGVGELAERTGQNNSGNRVLDGGPLWAARSYVARLAGAVPAGRRLISRNKPPPF